MNLPRSPMLAALLPFLLLAGACIGMTESIPEQDEHLNADPQELLPGTIEEALELRARGQKADALRMLSWVRTDALEAGRRAGKPDDWVCGMFGRYGNRCERLVPPPPEANESLNSAP